MSLSQCVEVQVQPPVVLWQIRSDGLSAKGNNESEVLVMSEIC